MKSKKTLLALGPVASKTHFSPCAKLGFDHQSISIKLIYIFIFSLLGVSCMTTSKSSPQAQSNTPKAEKKPHTHLQHGVQREDPYFWLKDRTNKEVIAYLNTENTNANSFFSKHKDLEDSIYNEILSRINEDDQSVPAPYKGHLYYSKSFKGKQYPAFYRKDIANNIEELLLDVNAEAVGTTYTSISFPKVSPDQQIMAYAWDKVGRRVYSIHFREIKNGQQLTDHQIENTTGNFVWSQDSQHIFYTQQDAETLRSYRLYRYELKTKINELVYQEDDETFNIGVSKSRSENFIYLTISSTQSSEVRYIEANQPLNPFKIFHPREKDHLYYLADDDKQFYILSNSQADNFQVLTANLQPTPKSQWKILIPHSKKSYINDFDVSKSHLIIKHREGGLDHIKIFNTADFKKSFSIPFQDEAYEVNFAANLNYESETFRFTYESKVQPVKTIDINLNTFKQTVVDVKKAPNFEAKNYKTKRIWISARDKTQVPVTLLMKSDHNLDATAPALIYAYGSYGAVLPINFSSSILSLIDRGFVYAFAHIRGGADLGREWYYDGRQLKKMNTFTDFIDVTEELIAKKYIHPKKIFAMGGSAGGLLMGAVANLKPSLYRGIVAQVPFVDVVTTMLDDSIPLTTGEYDEWGNPNNKTFFDYMLKYSPYDNVTDQGYPNMFITTGLHDSQVQYWEPAKWVARLRELNTSSAKIYFKTNMDAGHGGASGRYFRYREIAEEFTFILKMLDDSYEWRK